MQPASGLLHWDGPLPEPSPVTASSVHLRPTQAFVLVCCPDKRTAAQMLLHNRVEAGKQEVTTEETALFLYSSIY